MYALRTFKLNFMEKVINKMVFNILFPIQFNQLTVFMSYVILNLID